MWSDRHAVVDEQQIPARCRDRCSRGQQYGGRREAFRHNLDMRTVEP
jgi:hypothetical protein